MSELMEMRERLRLATQAHSTPHPSGVPPVPDPLVAENFPRVPPCAVPRFVSPTLRRQRATNRVILSQPSTIPTVPLRPAPTLAATPVTAGSATNPEAMRTGHTVDLQDPMSVEKVTGIVEEVLRRLGHSEVTFGGLRANGRRKGPNGKRLRQSMIKAQQAIMSPEQDLWWKVRYRFLIDTNS